MTSETRAAVDVNREPSRNVPLNPNSRSFWMAAAAGLLCPACWRVRVPPEECDCAPRMTPLVAVGSLTPSEERASNSLLH